MKKLLVLLVAAMACFSASAQVKSQPNWRGEIDVNVLFPVTNKGKNYKLNGKDLKDKIGAGIPTDCFQCTDTDFRILKDNVILNDGTLLVSNDEFRYQAVDSSTGVSVNYKIDPNKQLVSIEDEYGDYYFNYENEVTDNVAKGSETYYSQISGSEFRDLTIEKSTSDGIAMYYRVRDSNGFVANDIRIKHTGIELNGNYILINGEDLLQALEDIRARLNALEPDAPSE